MARNPETAAHGSGTRTRRRRLWIGALAAIPLIGLLVAVPQAGAANEVHLVAAGDFGARTATESVLTEMATRDPDAALALGDLAYRDVSTESAWCTYVKTKVGEAFPFELISGNHESLDVRDGDINNYSACLPNQIPGVVGTYGREYFMDLPQGDPLVRVINTSPGLTFEDGLWEYAEGDAHYTWLDSAIDGGRAKGARWIVVTAHIPCLSVGQYDCPSNTDFYDLLLSKNVDLVLHGHEHGYMRTHQLRSGVSGCASLAVGSFDADCVSDSDDAFINGQGTVFATVGTGGTPLRNVDAADPEADYFAAFSGLNENPTYGLLDIRATDTRLSAEFVPTSGAATDGFSIDVGPPPANQPPEPSFTTEVAELDVTVDGSASRDPDGTITSYEWDFGDGATDTGATPGTHTFDTPGTYTIELTVTDNEGEAATATEGVTVASTPPPNEPPTARFTTSVTHLEVTVDASASSDADGDIDSFAWDFGDGASATGATPEAHTYSAAGNYTITLEVTDDGGAVDTATEGVMVADPPAGDTLASDAFGRSVATGWGSADTGGDWTGNVETALSVGGGLGQQSNVRASTRSVYLQDVSSTSTNMTVSMGPDKATTGGGLYASVVGRSVPGAGAYRAKFVFRNDSRVVLELNRVSASGAETAIRSAAYIPGLTYSPSTPLNTRVEVTGTSPTTIRAKAWEPGDPEPAGWAAATTDSTPGLQAPGAIGVNTYLSSSATNSPIVLLVDDLRAVPVP